MSDKDLVDRIEFLLITQQYANLRTGEQRTLAKARSMMRKAAENVGVKVSTSNEGNYIIGRVKD